MDRVTPGRKGLGVVLSGPSGVGKNTVLDEICRLRPDAQVMVSWTTRQPRPGEKMDRDYHFVNRGEFLEKKDSDGFAEWALVHDEWYGTPKDELSALLNQGKLVLLILDIQGATAVQKLDLPLKLVFLEPPSMAELEGRLRGRGSEGEAQRSKRLERAKVELEKAGDYDFVLVNQEVASCASEICAQIAKWGNLTPSIDGAREL